MLPKQRMCFHPESEVGRHENLSTIKAILQDTEPGW
jgi:hypothetical protein